MYYSQNEIQHRNFTKYVASRENKNTRNIRSRKIRISLGVCNTDVNKISHSFMLYYAGLIQVKNIKRKGKN